MTEAGRHYDDGKPRVDLISPRALEELGKVLAYGAKKYGDQNWLNGIDWTKLYGSALRHLLAWRRREDTDPESGLPHLAHAMCNIMMLLHYVEVNCYDAHDDRPPLSIELREPPQLAMWPSPESIEVDKGQAGVQR